MSAALPRVAMGRCDSGATDVSAAANGIAYKSRYKRINDYLMDGKNTVTAVV